MSWTGWDKHRILLSAAVALTGIALDGDSYVLTIAKKYSGGDPSNVEPARWIPFETGTVLPGLGGSGLGVAEKTIRDLACLPEEARCLHLSFLELLPYRAENDHEYPFRHP
jgi:hypothetical protein